MAIKTKTKQQAQAKPIAAPSKPANIKSEFNLFDSNATADEIFAALMGKEKPKQVIDKK